MITVSDEFKAIWADKQGQAIQQRIRYKRRYKLGGVYYNETDWNVLDKPDFISIGSIPQQSDVNRNIIKTSVLSLKVPNENNQWIEHAGSPSFYAADAVATDGYTATRTLWQVQEGYTLAAGTIEWISVFTGIQLKKPKITGKSEFAIIEVSSNAALLEKADAEEVCTEPGLENCIPATGDGSNVDFESTSTGVDHAKLFEVNGANRTQGSQWRVSNDNEVASAGNTGRLAIKASSAPVAGHTVKTSVKKWLQNQRIETVLGLLADEAGISSGVRSIATVFFPGSLSGSKTIDSQAEWELGTVETNVDSVTSPGDLRQGWTCVDNFTDGNMDGWSGVTGWSVASNKLAAATPTDVSVNTICARATGSWQVKMDRSSGYADFAFMGGVSGGYYIVEPTQKKYFVRIDGTTIYLYKGVGAVDEVSSPTEVLLVSAAYSASAGDVYKVTRTAAGFMEVFANGVSKLTYTDTTYSTNVGIAVFASGNATFDDFYYNYNVVSTAASDTATYESEVFDLLSTPTAWSTLVATATLNSGTITYYTATSADGISFDAYVAVASGAVITSTLRRYLKIKAIITSATLTITSPSIDSIVANFATSDIFISLANHRGKTVMQQMEKYVKLPDYELRFKGDGTLVIGPKTNGTYVVHLTQENAIIDISEVDYGIPERVVRAGRVRYQGFVSVYGDTEASATAETIADGDELGKNVLDEDLDDTLVANDLDLGNSRARVLYDNNRRSATDPKPPVRLRMKIWDVPWLEVSDVVRTSYYDHPLLGVLQANDELLRADSPYFHMGAPGNVISAAKDWRVLYYSPNKDTGQADILVQEVL
jgi:hypothetical protein